MPAWSAGLAIPPTKEFVLNARRGGSYGIEWTINDQAFAGHEHHGAPMLTMDRGGWVRLRFVNASFRLHPIHLHGMFFRLLARNGVPVDEPFFRDTVLMHSQGDDRHRPGPARRRALDDALPHPRARRGGHDDAVRGPGLARGRGASATSFAACDRTGRCAPGTGGRSG